jgi:multidrug efflux pump subunit AcrB
LFFWQFNSARKVFIIVSTIPFCISGVFLVLALAQMPFDFMSNLGIFALMGTIVANGILVIEQIEEEQRAGVGLEDAVRNACRKRVRPIVVTQATTILGLIPLLVSGEPLWMSFNMVVMGGLTAGTLASLAWVPALYLLMFRRRRS